MTELENKTTTILKSETEFTTFADLTALCINNMPEGGLDVSEMRNRINVLDKAEKANGVLKLEEAESKTLKACVSGMKWRILHKDLIEFIETIENL